jgi:transcriptional regulator with GAF, ATPase, and Fis domain
MSDSLLAVTTLPGSSLRTGESHVRVQQIVLVHAPAAGPFAPMALTGSSVSIGRAPGDGDRFFVPDPEVSRTHVRLDREGDGPWILSDCGSRNGTLVNGVRTPRAELQDGAVIRVGQSLLVFVDVVLPPGAALLPEVRGLWGNSLRMQALRGEITLVAPRPVPVLILGETGAGKERVAQELHVQSARAGRFVPMNCAAIPEALAETELFGHAAGAFTGASTKNDGVFVAAEGGTLFLDEIGELPGAIQPKLLRALATGEIKPVGRSEVRTVDVRIVGATHRDIHASLATASFRADLFARLSAWTLRVPPLRDRRDDVLGLARAFLLEKRCSVDWSPDVAESLLLCDWPYNVRQLEQIIYAAAVRAERAGTMGVEHLPPELTRAVAARTPAGASRGISEPPLEVLVSRTAMPTAAQFRLVVERHGGNMAKVATFFRKDRRQIYRWAERFGIDPGSFREGEGAD